MSNKDLAEFSFDVQTGLGRYETAAINNVKSIGTAAALATHIRGLGEIDYNVLARVSDYYFDIPSLALPSALQTLAEAELISINKNGPQIRSITPEIPYFDDLYEIIGDYFADLSLTEEEQALVYVLERLRTKPEATQSLEQDSGIDPSLLQDVLSLGETGGLVRRQRARGRELLLSPFYFADNYQALADLAATAGSAAIESALRKLRSAQGWPLSFILKNDLGVARLTDVERDILRRMANEGIIKPPSIKWGGGAESFIFTPRPGDQRMNAANREIYERAMAILSAVRKGQLLANRFPIRSPRALLSAFSDRGYLRSNSEAGSQYQNLVAMRVAKLVKVPSGQQRLELIRNPENDRAIELALSLLESGDTTGLEVDQEARIALTKDERHIRSVVASKTLRERERTAFNPEAEEEFQQLLLQL